jgi:hypothetical protein
VVEPGEESENIPQAFSRLLYGIDRGDQDRFRMGIIQILAVCDVELTSGGGGPEERASGVSEERLIPRSLPV